MSRDELSVEEVSLISDEFFMEVRRNPDKDPYKIYSQVISEWGVMCHHPESCRRFGNDSDTWFFCGCCEAQVLGSFRTRLQTIIVSEWI